MRRINQAKPSPALLVAVIALVAALGGGAVAGVAVTSLSKKDKKQVTKIAKKQAKKLDKKIELKPGPEGDKGDPGATNVTRRLGPGSALVGAGQQTSDTASCNPEGGRPHPVPRRRDSDRPRPPQPLAELAALHAEGDLVEADAGAPRIGVNVLRGHCIQRLIAPAQVLLCLEQRHADGLSCLSVNEHPLFLDPLKPLRR